MKKTMLLGAGAVVGAIASYLFDPDRGKSRRAKLSDQAAAGVRDAAETVKAKVEYQKGVIKGAAHETAEAFESPEEVDDDTLLQKIRSEAVGPWSASHQGSVEVDIRDGNVRVTGSVGSDEERERLIERIRAVEGVENVEDRLQRTS